MKELKSLRQALRIALPLVLLVSPSMARSQEALSPMGVVTTSLGTHHPTAPDGRRFRCFSLQTRPGERYQVSLFSDAFNPVLRVGRGKDCTALSKPLEVRREEGERSATVEVAGDGELWSVSAGAISAGTGGFNLMVDRTVTVPATPVQIEPGRGVSSALTPDDAMTAQSKAYDCYAFRASRGDDLVATMRSSAFQPALQLYASPDCQGQPINSRNNWGEGTTMLTESIANSETYSLRALSQSRDAFGAYSLTISRNGQ